MKVVGTKAVTLLLVMAMMVSLLAGCAKSDSTGTGGQSGTDSGTATSETENSSTVSAGEEIPKDYEATLTMWGWDENYFNVMTAAFNEIYPNVTFEYTPVANGDLLQKYQTALATGTELPDIAWSIIDSRAKVYELDMWEALNEAPYNLDINEVFDYLHPLMVNSSGEVCGIEQGVNPAGIAYRKDLTLEYFGTDDPKELEAIFSSWDAFVEKGKEVSEKSGGTVFMWPGLGDAQQFIREQDGTAWFEGNTVKVTEAFQKPLDLAVEFRNAGIVDKLEAWTPAWYASYGEGQHIFAGCATWSVPFVIEPNDPDGQGQGHWGLMNAPEGNISWGGTTLGISKTSEEKAIAWEFIKFATLSTEGAKALNSIGFFTSAKQAYIDDPSLKSFKSEWFGDQDLGAFFLDEIVPNIKVRPMNVEDNIIHETLNLISTSLNNDREMTSDEALELLKEEINLKLPDYTIE